ncbi:DUF6053 domain-containing protein [Lysobacter enzymogenes]|uniref:DUF6053 domain-containing protein n=1 Tax=Lysobacter enzymogenes TaxID=69 RepID=UPI003D2F60B5
MRKVWACAESGSESVGPEGPPTTAEPLPPRRDRARGFCGRAFRPDARVSARRAQSAAAAIAR